MVGVIAQALLHTEYLALFCEPVAVKRVSKIAVHSTCGKTTRTNHLRYFSRGTWSWPPATCRRETIRNGSLQALQHPAMLPSLTSSADHYNHACKDP